MSKLFIEKQIIINIIACLYYYSHDTYVMIFVGLLFAINDVYDGVLYVLHVMRCAQHVKKLTN